MIDVSHLSKNIHSTWQLIAAVLLVKTLLATHLVALQTLSLFSWEYVTQESLPLLEKAQGIFGHEVLPDVCFPSFYSSICTNQPVSSRPFCT